MDSQPKRFGIAIPLRALAGFQAFVVLLKFG
jgi:hypothetical protein